MIDTLAMAALVLGGQAVTWGILLKHGERLSRIEARCELHFMGVKNGRDKL